MRRWPNITTSIISIASMCKTNANRTQVQLINVFTLSLPLYLLALYFFSC